MAHFTGELLPHQLAFIEDVTTPEIALVAGYGAGKSTSIVVKAIHLASLNIGYTGVVVEPSFPMIMEPLLPLMFDALETYGIPYRFRKSPNPILTLRFEGGDSTILFKSAEQMDKLRGINAAWIIVDEIDTLGASKAKQLWQILQGRVRYGHTRQACCASTPEGYGFLYEHFVMDTLDKLEGRRIIKARTYDNPFLPEDYITTLLKNYPEAMINAYLNGEFVNLTSGNVYHSFNRNINATTKNMDDFPEKGRVIHIGLDFNINNCAATIIVIDKGKIYIVDEITKQHNTEAMIKEIKRKYGDRMVRTYPDSSGKSEHTNASSTDIALLQSAGLNPLYPTKNPPIRDRVGSVNAKIKNGNGEVGLYVNITKCPAVTKTFEQQGFASDGKPDKTKGLDHQGDSAGYPIHYLFPINNKPVVNVY